MRVRPSFEMQIDKACEEVRKIAHENSYSKGIVITIKMRCDETPTIDYKVEDKIINVWDGGFNG